MTGEVIFLFVFFYIFLSNTFSVGATQCFSSWIGLSTAISWAHLNPIASRDFIICPNSLFDLEIHDPSFYPINIEIDNVLVRCGDNSGDNVNMNECVISGGWASFKITGEAKNVIIDGITFKSSSLAPILATGKPDASAQITRCLFQWNRGLSTILVYNEENEVVLTPEITISEITNQPNMKRSMALSVANTIFDENHVKTAVVMSLGGRVTMDESVFASNLVTLGVVGALSGTYLALMNSCFVANIVGRESGVIYVDPTAFLTDNSFNFGLENHVENGRCTSLFLDVDGQCINNPELQCGGICTKFTSDKCKTSLGIDIIDDFSPSGAPSMSMELGTTDSYFVFNFNARNTAILVLSLLGLFVVLCSGYISAYRLGQKSIVKKYRNHTMLSTEELNEEEDVEDEEAKVDPILINSDICVTANDSEEESDKISPANTVLAINGDLSKGNTQPVISAPSWVHEAENDNSVSVPSNEKIQIPKNENNKSPSPRWKVAEIPKFNVKTFNAGSDDGYNSNQRGEDILTASSNTSNSGRGSNTFGPMPQVTSQNTPSSAHPRQGLNPFDGNDNDISWSMERVDNQEHHKPDPDESVSSRDSSLRGTNPFDFSWEKSSDIDSTRTDMDNLSIPSNCNAYASFGLTNAETTDGAVEWSFDKGTDTFKL